MRYIVCFCSAYWYHPDLHSFPTRRSSDLYQQVGQRQLVEIDKLPDRPAAQVHECFRLDEKNLLAVLVYFAQLGLKPTLKAAGDRKSTRLNSSHTVISYAVFCLKKKKL